MTPDRFRECLVALRWSAKSFARAIGTSEMVVRNMAAGRREIEDVVWVYLERHMECEKQCPVPRIKR